MSIAAASITLLAAAPAFAQPPTQPAPPADATAANPRAVTAEVPIVAGNAASAKQRAMDEAFRQAVERSFTALLAEAGMGPTEPLPPSLAQLRTAFFSRARRYVRSYRILEQGENAGRFRVVIDAEVDDGVLRREIDRARAGAAPLVAGPRPGARAPSAVVAGTPPEAVVALTRALGSAGIRAEAPPLGAVPESKVQEIAGRSGAAAIVLTGQVATDGPVRGTSRTAASCRLQARLLPAGGAPASDRSSETRAFADGEAAARGDCLARAAAELARQVSETLAPAGGTATAAGRAVTLELDLVEPAALPLVLQALKKVGSVSSAEVRRVVVGHVEVRAATRLAAPALAAALARELSGAAAVVVGQAVADRVSIQVRMTAPQVLPGAGAANIP